MLLEPPGSKAIASSAECPQRGVWAHPVGHTHHRVRTPGRHCARRHGTDHVHTRCGLQSTCGSTAARAGAVHLQAALGRWPIAAGESTPQSPARVAPTARGCHLFLNAPRTGACTCSSSATAFRMLPGITPQTHFTVPHPKPRLRLGFWKCPTYTAIASRNEKDCD